MSPFVDGGRPTTCPIEYNRHTLRPPRRVYSLSRHISALGVGAGPRGLPARRQPRPFCMARRPNWWTINIERSSARIPLRLEPCDESSQIAFESFSLTGFFEFTKFRRLRSLKFRETEHDSVAPSADRPFQHIDQ